jgi:hypothetical protein
LELIDVSPNYQILEFSRTLSTNFGKLQKLIAKPGDNEIGMEVARIGQSPGIGSEGHGLGTLRETL